MKTYFAHETAIIDSNCSIGAGTKIWHFSHIMKNATLGKGCNVGQNVVVSTEVVLGNNVKVQNNVSIYTGVTCEDDVFLGPSMVFTNVINPRSAIIRRDEFMKTKVGFGTPSTLTGSSAAATEANLANFFGQEAVGSNVAKMTLKDKAYKTFGTAAVDTFSKLTKPVTDIVKDPVKELVVDPITGMAKDVTGEKILDTIAGERREKSLLGSPVYTTKTGDFDSSGGFAPLMSLSIDTQSPYISYNQGQQLFGMKGQA